MIIIGLTGNMGTGKSTVAEMLKELGASVIDADKAGHELLQPGSPAYGEILATFGSSFLNADGTIDRRKLGKVVFSHASGKATLDRIMLPRIHESIKQRLDEYRRQGKKVVVLEAALLDEDNLPSQADRVWVTVASTETILQRVKEQRGMSEEDALMRLHTQKPSAEKVKNADAVINTDCTLDKLRKRVEELWKELAS